MGLLSDDAHVEKHVNPLDTLSAHLAKRLSFGPNERDIVIMHHEVGVRWPSASSDESELNTIDMVVYGDQKHSAMAKTVGLPAAIATRMLIQSKCSAIGIDASLARFSFSLQTRFMSEALSYQ